MNKNIKKLAVYSLLIAMLTGCKKQDKREFNVPYSVVIDEILDNGNDIEHSNNFLCYYKINKANEKYLNEYFYLNGLKSYDEICNVSAFANLIDSTNPTYEMVVGQVDQNNDLNSEYKELFKKEISDIHFYNKNLELSIVNFNMPKLKVKEVNEDKEYYSIFNPYDCTIYINTKYANTEELKKYALLDALGYTYITAYTTIDNKKILCANYEYNLHIDYMYYDDKVIKAGDTFENGLAAILAANNGNIDGNIDLNDAENAGILKYNLALNGMTLDEYEKEGFEGLCNRIRLNGDNEMFMYLIKYDDPSYGKSKWETTKNITEIKIRKLKSNGWSNEEINNYLIGIVDDCYSNIIMPEIKSLYEVTRPQELKMTIQFETREEKTR